MIDLKSRVIAGGRGLVIRSIAGLGLSFVNVFVLTRILGPANYGLFAGPLALFTYASMLGQLGISAYLVRRADAPTAEEYHQAFTILFLSGCLILLVAGVATVLIGSLVTVSGFGSVLWVMLAILPVSLATQVPSAQLDRALRFPSTAKIDLLTQVLGLAVALPLAVMGAGVWAPTLGLLTQQLVSTVAVFRLSTYRPRLRLHRAEASAMLKYGLGYSTSGWIYQLRLLVNPLIVGPVLGAGAMGIVGLTVRITETLSFAKPIAWRMSLATFPQLGNDPKRLGRWMRLGMQAQVLMVGAPLLVLAFVLPVLTGWILGDKWHGMEQLYPFVACGVLVSSVFTMQASVLHVFAHNLDAARFSITYIAVLVLGVLLLIPKLGLVGYGWAELVAMPAYVVVHFAVIRRFRERTNNIGLLWALAIGLAFFWRQLGWISASGLVAALAIPASRSAGKSWWNRIRNSIGSRSTGRTDLD